MNLVCFATRNSDCETTGGLIMPMNGVPQEAKLVRLEV
jgi:hypothetical protein